MPLTTKTVDLDAERDRLQERMVELAEEQANYDGDANRAEQLMARGNQLDRYIGALDWAESEWGVSKIELAGLSPGEINRVEDTVEQNQGVRERDAWVAIGTRSTNLPYVEHDPDAITQPDFEATVGYLVDNVPLPFIRWAEEQITDLSHLGLDEGNGYLALVREKQREKSTN